MNKITKQVAVNLIISALRNAEIEKLTEVLKLLLPEREDEVLDGSLKICWQCNTDPAEPKGDMCYDCLCGTRSGCPRKYGKEGEACPHDWCPHGGKSPTYRY